MKNNNDFREIPPTPMPVYAAPPSPQSQPGSFGGSGYQNMEQRPMYVYAAPPPFTEKKGFFSRFLSIFKKNR